MFGTARFGIAVFGLCVATACSTTSSGGGEAADDRRAVDTVVAPAAPEPPDPVDEVTVPTSRPTGRPVSEGRLKVLVHAKTAFDPYTKPKDPETWRVLRSSYDAMIVYSPYFDTREPFFADTFVYIDMYGLKVNNPNETLAADNPDWVLRTASGDPVYIPWGCQSPNGCPQFAADVGHPDYQDGFVERVRGLVEVGYEGVLIDDVNLVWRLSDRQGATVNPVNPRTGEALTLEEWRSDVVDLLERVRREFPDTRIMHNSIWFADSPDFDDPFVERQIAAADVIMLERGATDAGLVRGGGQFGFASFLSYIDRAHRLGANVLLLDQTAQTDREQTFNLVTGLLVNDGGDYVSTQDYALMAPGSLWPGFGTDLGDATGPRTEDDGVWRRNFDAGIVVLNEPGREARVVELGGEFLTDDGRVVSELRLDGGEAALLLHS